LAESKTTGAVEVSRAEQQAREAGVVVVEIYDQVYQLRGTDAARIEALASLVDKKMRAVSAHGSTVDSLRVAVLAALNIADELAALQDRFGALADESVQEQNAVQASVQSRADSLMGMLDEVLSERKAG
jgi:cell division protein ZapA